MLQGKLDRLWSKNVRSSKKEANLSLRRKTKKVILNMYFCLLVR